MPAARAFVDTNVLAYLFSKDEPQKRERSIQSINDYDCHVSTQVLNEFCSICTRKWHFPARDISRALDKICSFAALWPVNFANVKSAVLLHEKYGYAYYDCLILASALACDCEYLLSEDLNDGQVVEGRLTIKNIY